MLDHTNVVRDMDKALTVVTSCVNHLVYRDESNAALHLARDVRKAPLTVALEGALESLIRVRNDVQGDAKSFTTQLGDLVTNDKVVFRSELGDYVVDLGAVEQQVDGTVIVLLTEAGK